MATFPYLPDLGASPDLTPRLRSVQFGDGYRQRAEDGLNTIQPSWKLTFSSRTQLEAQAIGAWMIANKAHVNAFDWAAPGEGNVSSETILTGDGTRNTAQLSHLGRAVQYTGTPTIYRTDGSGTVALSSGTDYTLSANGLVTLAPTTNPVVSQNIGTGTGSTAAFTITTPNGTTPTVTGVWKTDWQGRRRMSPNPRTNSLPRHRPQVTYWICDNSGLGSIPTMTENFAAAPDGTTTATRLQFSRTAGTGFSRCFINFSVASGIWCSSIWLKSNDGAYRSISLGVGSDRRVVSITPSWQRFSITSLSAITLAFCELMIWGNSNTDLTADILSWGGQTEPGASSASYDPNHASISQSDHCTIATSNSTRISLSRPIVDGQDYNYFNPGARIARFKTNSGYVGLKFDCTMLWTRIDTYNSIGWVFVNGVAYQPFNMILGTSGVTVPLMVELFLDQGIEKTIEVVCPYGTSLDFNGVDLETGASLLSAAPRPSTRYVAAGDSITHGYSATSVITTWPFLLASSKNWQIINLGYGSRTCVPSDGTHLGNLNPDVATYLIGFNDFYAQTALATFKSNYIAYINAFRAICPTKKLYCITPTWSSATNTLTLEMYRQQIRDALTQLNNPLNVLVEGLTLAPNDVTNFSNGPHPGDIGSAAIAASLASLVTL